MDWKCISQCVLSLAHIISSSSRVASDLTCNDSGKNGRFSVFNNQKLKVVAYFNICLICLSSGDSKLRQSASGVVGCSAGRHGLLFPQLSLYGLLWAFILYSAITSLILCERRVLKNSTSGDGEADGLYESLVRLGRAFSPPVLWKRFLFWCPWSSSG